MLGIFNWNNFDNKYLVKYEVNYDFSSDNNRKDKDNIDG